MYLPHIEDIKNLPRYTSQQPMRILFSACLRGTKCGIDGSSNGEWPLILKLAALQNVKAVSFCPEHFAFGTPRDLPDIHGGNGFDVLDGKAKVLSNKGEDMTAGMITAAQKMLALAQTEQIDLAVLMDMSAACGVQVISLGGRLTDQRVYQKGPGVSTALLIRQGFRVVSQRDFKT